MTPELITNIFEAWLPYITVGFTILIAALCVLAFLTSVIVEVLKNAIDKYLEIPTAAFTVAVGIVLTYLAAVAFMAIVGFPIGWCVHVGAPIAGILVGGIACGGWDLIMRNIRKVKPPKEITDKLKK